AEEVVMGDVGSVMVNGPLVETTTLTRHGPSSLQFSVTAPVTMVEVDHMLRQHPPSQAPVMADFLGVLDSQSGVVIEFKNTIVEGDRRKARDQVAQGRKHLGSSHHLRFVHCFLVVPDKSVRLFKRSLPARIQVRASGSRWHPPT
ncbi:MAG: hypothetical protein MUE31_07675, partial [Candidatus Nanopelagicales bacterium]|nr:hypothetical protein [Candidatus Nanopelagicales bacterium]